jgi:hypothetical protein
MLLAVMLVVQEQKGRFLMSVLPLLANWLSFYLTITCDVSLALSQANQGI